MQSPTLSSPEFARLLTALHRRARRLDRCPEEAADLAQEAAMKLLQKLESGARIDRPEAYAMTALANLARSRWRGKRPSEELTDDAATTEPDALARIACGEIAAAIARLPEPQARLIQLVAVGETRPADLARTTGVPLGTVMSRLARARATLRHEMGLGARTPSSELYEMR